MAKVFSDIQITIKINPKISLWNAIKMRIAGGKSAVHFWDSLAEQIKKTTDNEIKEAR